MASIAELHLSEAAEALGFRRAGPDAAVHGCAIDSRTVKPGELFVALEGEQVDGWIGMQPSREPCRRPD